MINGSDKRKDITIKILKDICGISFDKLVRYPNGYCHSVYYVKAGNNEYVIRITGRDNEIYYSGSLKWLSELYRIGIPVPEVLRHGQYEDVFFTLISFMKGNDLGDIYNTLTDYDKRNIVKSLSAIQRKVSSLPAGELYGYSADECLYKTWIDFLNSQIDRARKRIQQNGIWDADLCDTVTVKMGILKEYFMNVKLITFLGDITTKNVLVYKGGLSGIVDVDEICYGDSLAVIGLTNMALLKMEADTNYIDYWLDEMSANETERKSVIFYTLLFCADFMGEQGMRFDNGNNVPVNKNTIELLNTIYIRLCGML